MPTYGVNGETSRGLNLSSGDLIEAIEVSHAHTAQIVPSIEVAEKAGELMVGEALDYLFDVVEDERDWQERALCAQTDPEAFFPEKGGSTREAKRICLGCEVRTDCLKYALEHDERFGIWGGLSERQRRNLKKRST